MNRETCVNLVAFIDSALGRGAIKPSEMVSVGVAREELLALVAYVDAQAAVAEVEPELAPVKQLLQEEILDNVDVGELGGC